MSFLLEYELLREISENMYNAIWSTYDMYRRKFENGKISIKEFAGILDYASANALKEYLKRESMDNKVISEEGFEDYRGSKYPVIVVDPIDGTSNFTRNVPFSAISIALSKSDNFSDIYVGLVMNLFTRDIYFGYKGKGAYKNSRRIRASRIRDTRISHMSISITHAIPMKSPSLYILRYTNYPRHFGSAALEDCFVGEGILDAHIDVRGDLRVFDIAASQLIVREAGGKVIVKQYDKPHISLSKIGGIKIVSASTPQLLERITEILRWP